MNLRALSVGLVGALTLSTSACGSASDDDVAKVTQAFYDALGSEDGARACSLLAPPTRSEVEKSSGQPCEEAILDESVQEASGAPRVDAYATMAIVRWAQETTFVTRYDDGWLVFAAGCSPDSKSPPDADRFDCNLQGG